MRCNIKFKQFLENFAQAEGLSDIFRTNATRYFNAYACRLSELAVVHERPLIVGINGAQGSGKSTLSDYLSQMMASVLDVDCHVVSIDDFYLTRMERQNLARSIHPLLATRGVPGTHDCDRLRDALAAFIDPKCTTVELPVFDKLADDRTNLVRKIQMSAKPTVILLEGWCVGIPAQGQLALSVPVSNFEFTHDNGGTWRAYVNDQLKGPYAEIFDRIDRLSMLRSPSFESVFAWRLEQESRLVARRQMGDGRAPVTGMSASEVAEFIESFRRLTYHAIEVLPALSADVWELQADRCIVYERLHS